MITMRRAVLSFALVLTVAQAQSPTVVSTSPARNTTMGPFDPIRVVFAAPIAPATVTSQSFAVFGRWTGAVTGALSVDTTATTVTFQPSAPLFVGDQMRVDLASTITSALGAPMPGGFHFEVTVRSGPGSGLFQQTQTINFRLPAEGWIGTYGIYGGDIDRDGSADVIAVNENAHDLRVLKNGGCANFGAMTFAQDGQNYPSPHESADFNRDGWLDLATGDSGAGNVSVFVNNGAGSFLPPITLAGNAYIRSVGAGDLNGDCFPDLVAGNGAATLVWINDGVGGFLPPVFYPFQQSTEINVVDVNEDGKLDVVGCTGWSQHLWVLLGNGDGTLTPNATMIPVGTQPFASASGDLNNDGHIDIAYCGSQPHAFVWLFGDGNGNFTPGGSVYSGLYSTSIKLADLEGDGDVDAVVANYSSADFYIHLNNGTGGFAAPVILPAVGGAACTTLVDFDRDGDLDIMGADEVVDVGLLFTQTNPSNPSLQPADCDATLRIDQRADGAGFGTPPVPVHAGAAMAISLSGPGSALGVIALGYPSPVSFPLAPWGLISIDALMPFLLIGAGLLDPHGEMMMPLSFPVSAPLGSTLALQGLMFLPTGERLTNPMQFVLVP